MKITQKYSHLNGEEYLLVHHKEHYQEIQRIIASMDAHQWMIKKSKEKTKKGRMLYSPISLNKEFNKQFRAVGWHESRYKYYLTTNPELMNQLIVLPYTKQKDFLIQQGEHPIASYKQTDFVKDKIAIEIQFACTTAYTRD